MKKLLLSCFVLAVTSYSYGQIIYHNNGGLTYFGGFDLDMDNNGFPEYELSVLSSQTQLSFYGDNCVAKGANIVFFNNGQMINSSVSWQCNDGYWHPVNAPDQQVKTIGLKFFLNNQPHYGWVRVELQLGGDAFVVWDYAYNATPNTPIPAAQTWNASIEDYSMFSGFTNVQDGLLMIEANSSLNDVELYTMNGKNVYKEFVQNNSILIDVSQFSHGIYLLKIGSSFKKILL